MITVITPMFNEEECISANIRKLSAAIDGIGEDWELIIVDDGSTDKSLEYAKSAMKEKKNIRILSYKPNRGRGYALRQGFSHAKGDIIITTESDLSWGADIVRKLFYAINKSNYDIVIASPHKKGGGFVNVPFFRVLLTTVGNKILGRAFPGNLTMLSGMTRAYKREVIDSLELISDGKEIHPEIISKAYALGFRATEIPAILKWTGKRTGRRSTFDAKKLMFSHLMLGFNEGPLIILGSIGMSFMLIGIIAAFYSFHLWLTESLSNHIPIVMFTLIMLSLGVQTLVFSFLAYQNRELRNEIFRMEGNLLKIRKGK
ncbi:MAG: glycosyltransferase family 2 protein [Candidatus Woesearchaeota archaeon]|nr:glycosyltransferase family 2 protein [Candidatus Woesearchaeota archaeon]